MSFARFKGFSLWIVFQWFGSVKYDDGMHLLGWIGLSERNSV